MLLIVKATEKNWSDTFDYLKRWTETLYFYFHKKTLLVIDRNG